MENIRIFSIVSSLIIFSLTPDVFACDDLKTVVDQAKMRVMNAEGWVKKYKSGKFTSLLDIMRSLDRGSEDTNEEYFSKVFDQLEAQIDYIEEHIDLGPALEELTAKYKQAPAGPPQWS